MIREIEEKNLVSFLIKQFTRNRLSMRENDKICIKKRRVGICFVSGVDEGLFSKGFSTSDRDRDRRRPRRNDSRRCGTRALALSPPSLHRHTEIRGNFEIEHSQSRHLFGLSSVMVRNTESVVATGTHISSVSGSAASYAAWLGL